jgi:hypothetical protein
MVLMFIPTRMVQSDITGHVETMMINLDQYEKKIWLACDDTN